MADQLKAEINVDNLQVGPNPTKPNKVKLLITNSGEAIRWKGNEPHLYLKGTLGSGEDALFLGEADVRQCQLSVDGEDGWYAVWNYSATAEQKFCLDIYKFDPEILAPSKNPLTITLEKVISQTAPGNASLTFEVSIPSFEQAKQALSVTKAPDKPDIINFTSEPPEGVQNFPNESVTLRWLVYELRSLELTRVGSTDFLPFDIKEDPKNKTVQGIATIKNLSVDTDFRLRGYAGSKPVDRTLGVRVLRNDWYELRKTISPGDGGYPPARDADEARALKDRTAPRFELEPTLVFNVNDQSLYAIFRHDFDGEKRALLFQTENPFGGWNFVDSRVDGQPGLFIPDGLSTSPGIYFNGQLWLLGGSQVESGNRSNEVWCFNRNDKVWTQKTWKGKKDKIWSERMGHGVVNFDNKMIWVMGGYDRTGASLNDVWALDAGDENSEWVPKGKAPWEPRCLISPTFYDNRIWVYGGTKQPKSAVLYDDLYSYSLEDGWKKMEMTGIIRGKDAREPIASCLQVFQNKLHLLGKFQTISDVDASQLVESLAFSLTNLRTRTWSRFPSDRLQNWWGDTTFSYQLVNFKARRTKENAKDSAKDDTEDRMLIARALGDRTPNIVLKVYV